VRLVAKQAELGLRGRVALQQVACGRGQFLADARGKSRGELRGLLLSAEAARNTIFGYFPKVQGAGYQLDRMDFLTSNAAQQFAGTDFKGGKVNSEIQTFFRPSDVAVGPDGAIYVADWFDPRVGGHDDKDDTTSGAIYRIAPKGFKPVIPAFDAGTIEGQITALRSPAVNVRAAGYSGLTRRGAAALPTVEALLQDDNPFIRARAVWVMARLGEGGLNRVESLTGHADPMMRIAAYRTLRQMGKAMSFADKLARDPSPAVRREVALSLRDVPFASSRDLLLTLAAGYDGKDRSYLEAWGIGATNKEAPLYTALAATQPERDATKWSQAYSDLVWRLTPAEAVPAFAARAGAATLPVTERTKATTALGFITTPESAASLLDVAQHGGTDIKQNQALWWLINYKDSRWAGQGIDAELKRRGLYDADAVVISEVVVPAPPEKSALPAVADIAKLRGDAKRGATAAAACLLCHQIKGQGVDFGPALDGFASRQTRDVVITAIVNPSNDIAHGYEGTELALTDGKKVHGMVLSGGNPLIVQSTGGATQMIPAALIKERKRLGRSLMLSADQLGLTAQQVADIVAYLK
jgi:putative heme-binding domain-containing protein